MRAFSILIIIAGTVGAAVSAAHIPLLWLEFTIFLIITGFGIYLKRKRTSAALKDQDNLSNPVSQLRSLIDEYIELLADVIKDANVINNLLENCNIEHLYNQIEQIRTGIIDKLGMNAYISIISPLARAERLLYRGYSSATDGYNEEAKQSLTRSLEFFKITKELLDKI